MILTEIKTYNSKNIKVSEYDFLTKDLILTFKGGRKYKYKSVDETIYQKFTSSESVGSSFHLLIKNNFEFENLD